MVCLSVDVWSWEGGYMCNRCLLFVFFVIEFMILSFDFLDNILVILFVLVELCYWVSYF